MRGLHGSSQGGEGCADVLPECGPGALVIDLLEAAVRVEGKGQLNMGKVLRASATAVARRAAARGGFPRDTHRLVSDLRGLSERLSAAGVEAEIPDQVALAATLVERGGFADLERFPDVHVCRRCGAMAAPTPEEYCPSCGAHALTFQRFSTTYWSAEWQPHEVVERLAKNPSLFRAALGLIPPERRAWAPARRAWSTVDVLRHVRDANALFAERVGLILDADDPPLVARATYAWSEQDPAESAESLLEAYVSARGDVVGRLGALDPRAWRRTGRHPGVGRVTLAEQASFFAAHELTHLRQLEMLRRSMEADERR